MYITRNLILEDNDYKCADFPNSLCYCIITGDGMDAIFLTFASTNVDADVRFQIHEC